MERIGRYVVERELGRGGMARAVLARNVDGNVVVLKVPLKNDPDTIGRLREEARTGVRVSHPNLIQTLDFFEHEGLPVLVLAFVDGVSVHALVQKLGALPYDAVAHLGAGVAAALHVIHSATDELGSPLSIVHRDVSVGNILVDRQGDSRLIDLGLARSAEALHKTQTGMLLGTLPYFAPELLNEAPYTPSSDIWAFACVLFEAATGHRLFAGKNEGAIVGKIMMGDIFDNPGWAILDPHLRPIIEQMLDRDPARRLSDGRVISDKLKAVAAASGQHSLARAVRTLAPENAPEFQDTVRFYLPEDTVVAFARDPQSGGWEGQFAMLGNDASVEAVRSALFGLAYPRPISMPVAGVSDSLGGGPGFDAPEFAAGGFTPHEPLIARDISTPTSSAPRQSAPLHSDRFRPPPVAAAPELDLSLGRTLKAGAGREPNAEAGGAAAHHPKIKNRKSNWVGVGALFLVTLVVGGVLINQYRKEDAEAALEALRARALQEANELEALTRPPPGAPDCYSAGVAALYVYKNGTGNNVAVEKLEAIPLGLRPTARCIPKQ